MEPAAGHPPGLVNPAVDEEQLLLADPVALVNEAPKHAHKLQQQVEFLEQRSFGWARRVKRPGRQHEGVKGQVVDPLAEGEAAALG